MNAILVFASYLAAIAAILLFWSGLAKGMLLLRFAAAAAATVGIWMGESAERRARSGFGLAATFNGALLFLMAAVSLYLHFAE